MSPVRPWAFTQSTPVPSRVLTTGFRNAIASSCTIPNASLRCVDWVNAHGLTGLTVPPGDAGALRQALATLLVSPALRERFGATGRRRVEQEYTTARAAEAVLAVYRELTWGLSTSELSTSRPGAAPDRERTRDVA